MGQAGHVALGVTQQAVQLEAPARWQQHRCTHTDIKVYTDRYRNADTHSTKTNTGTDAHTKTCVNTAVST